MEKIEEQILKKCREVAIAKIDDIMRPVQDYYASPVVKVRKINDQHIGQVFDEIHEALVQDLTTTLANKAVDGLAELAIHAT